MERFYESQIAPVAGLCEETIASMSRLYLESYDGTSEELFRADLAEKHEAILVRCGGALVGFTTLKVYEHPWDDRRARILYSGDTVVSRAHWGQQQLAFTWIAHAGELKRQAPHLPLYWFLLVKGHRTFKYLPVFAKSFFPHWSLDRPDLKELADRLASARFGTCYDPSSGVVHFPESRGHLKPAISEASCEERAKPSTRFFLRANPGYRAGDELVCVCELEPSNLKPLAARIFAPRPRELAAAW